jgi:hypothetical protein
MEREVIMSCIRAIIAGETIPSDSDLALRYNVSERTIREIRLKHGLNRHHLKRQISEHKGDVKETESMRIYTPYAGIWLLIPMILGSYISKAVDLIKMPYFNTTSYWHLLSS